MRFSRIEAIAMVVAVAAVAAMLGSVNFASASPGAGDICGLADGGDGNSYYMRMAWATNLYSDGMTRRELVCSSTNEVAFAQTREPDWDVTMAPVADEVVPTQYIVTDPTRSVFERYVVQHPWRAGATVVAITATADARAFAPTQIALDAAATRAAYTNRVDAVVYGLYDDGYGDCHDPHLGRRVLKSCGGTIRFGNFCGHKHNDNGTISWYGNSDGRGGVTGIQPHQIVDRNLDQNSDIEWSLDCEFHAGTHGTGTSQHTHTKQGIENH